MKLWRRWIRRAGLVLRHGRAERELDEELRFHLEREEEALRAAGLPPGEAARRARSAFGNVDRWRQATRDARGIRPLEEVAQDLRFAVRALRHRPAMTAATLVTVAVGVGALTGAFGMLRAVVLAPLPYGEADRIMAVGTAWQDQTDGGISPAEHFDLERDVQDAFVAYGAYATGDLTLTGDGEPLRVEGAFLSHGAFPALGGVPIVGRTFTRAEDRADAPVVLLSHSLWRDRFAGDDAVLGRALTVNETVVTVIGVLPPGFRLPEDLVGGTRTDLYLPLGLDPAMVDNRGSHFMAGVARLRDGTPQARGTAVVEAIGRRWTKAYPDDYPADMAFRTWATPLTDRVLGGARPVLGTLIGSAVLVLLLVVMNVAGLHLAAAEGRRREFAVRRSLGAGPGRLLRQIFTESVLTALVGGVLGLAVAHGATQLLLALDPPNLPRLSASGVTPGVAAVGLLSAVLAGVLYAVGPALRLVPTGRSGEPAAGLRQAERGATGTTGGVRGLLVAGEVAFAVVVLAGAALFLRSFQALVSVDPGFRPESVLTAAISLPSERYPEGADPARFQAELERRLSVLPGVRAAGAVSNLPLATGLGDLNFEIEGRPVPDDERSPHADWQVATPGYREAIGLGLVRGRWLRPGDHESAPGVVVISESAAQRYWPDEDPIGQRFRLGGGAGPGWVRIMGIVRDVRHDGLVEPPNPQMYLSHAQFRFWGSGAPVRSLTVVLRAERNPASLAAPLAQAVRDLDPLLPVFDVQTMEQVLARSVSQPRSLATVLGVFSVIAVLLAAVGVYGIIAHSVAERRRELAIRVALGARAGRVVWEVLRRGGVLVLCGAIAGLAVSLLIGRGLRAQLYGVDPADPATLLWIAAGLSLLGLIAAWLPARRAAGIDPALPLRVE